MERYNTSIKVSEPLSWHEHMACKTPAPTSLDKLIPICTFQDIEVTHLLARSTPKTLLALTKCC